MAVEAVCFEHAHAYLKSDQHDGYVCRNCRDFIPMAEFEKRTSPGAQADGLIPIDLCFHCKTWHTPLNFDVNTRKYR